MSHLAARIEKAAQKAADRRRRQAEGFERITCVVVELPAAADFPIGTERVIFPAHGLSPALIEVAV